MFPFFESIALQNGELQNLFYHQKRINQTFAHFYTNQKVLCLEDILSKSPLPKDDNKFKVRFLYNSTEHKIVIELYQDKIVEKFYLVETEIDYSYKFANRENLNQIAAKLPELNADFIMVKNGLITDSFYANLVFFDDENWFTPNSFLLNGCMRQRMIDEKKIFEKKIGVRDLKKYQKFKRINAMLGLEDSFTYDVSQIKDETG